MRLFVLTLGLLGLGVTPAVAKDEAPPSPEQSMVKYRQLEMSAIARHFGSIKRIVKGEVDRPQDLAGHTAAVVALSKDLPGQFPKGTGPDSKLDTSVLDTVWTESEKFAKMAKDFEAAAAALDAAAQKGDMEAVAAAFGKTGELCGSCHDDFTKD